MSDHLAPFKINSSYRVIAIDSNNANYLYKHHSKLKNWINKIKFTNKKIPKQNRENIKFLRF